MNKLKVAFIGAGSRSFAGRTLVDLLLSEPLRAFDLELVLMDVIADHITRTEAFCRRAAAQLGYPVTIRTTTVLESEVRRYPGSVSLFAPGSFSKRPPLDTALPAIVCAGDWVRMGSREHGAKGLCQERAYVCGLEAANSLIRRKVVTTSTSPAREHPVRPIRADEPQVLIGRALNALLMNQAEALGLRWPWLR